MAIPDYVRREVRRRFTDDAADEVERLLATATQNSGLQEPDRIHFAILRIADGDLAAVRRGAEVAAVNWREVLSSAGLGERDWRLVLMHAGVELEPIVFHGAVLLLSTGVVSVRREVRPGARVSRSRFFTAFTVLHFLHVNVENRLSAPTHP